MPAGTQTYFGAMTLSPPGGRAIGLGFTSTRRFAGHFTCAPVLAPGCRRHRRTGTETGRVLGAGGVHVLTRADSCERAGRDRRSLSRNHPPLRFNAPPTGWCSWYCFGPRVTAQQVLDNLDVIAKQIPGLKYVQIDDGYQPAMGDWLETGAAFGGDVQSVLEEIRERGFEPAIWVAPFIAENSSHVFQAASRLVHQGRRRHAAAVGQRDVRRLAARAVVRARRHAPGGAAHLEHVFRTMRARVGLHLLQARRELLGRDARRPLPRPEGDAHRGVSARHGGDPARRGRRLHSRLQPSDLAVVRADPRIAQLERHQARRGIASRRPRGRT